MSCLAMDTQHLERETNMSEKKTDEWWAEWAQTLVKGAMSLPFVKIDRDEFLSSITPPGKIVDWSKHVPLDFYPKDKISYFAEGVIRKHRLGATGSSAALGLIPPGPLTPAGITSDMLQYTGHMLIVAQKLAYLYGFPSLTDKNRTWTDSASSILILCLGAALGGEEAIKIIHRFAREIAKIVAKKLPLKTFGNAAWYIALKQLMAWVGIKLNKDVFAQGVAKVIPFVGAILSGGVTYFSFGQMARRLKETLEKDVEAFATWKDEGKIADEEPFTPVDE